MRKDKMYWWRCDCGAYIEEGDERCWRCGSRFIWKREKYTEDMVARIRSYEKEVQVKEDKEVDV